MTDGGAEWVCAIRQELLAVQRHLIDPSAEGVSGCLPHLENAIQALQTASGAPGQKLMAPADLEELRRQLSAASRLFENAYQLQAGWAALQGLSFDGTPADALYGQSGGWVTTANPAVTGTEVWQA